MLTADNCAFLLQKCRRMSTRDVLALLVDLRLRHEPEQALVAQGVSRGIGGELQQLQDKRRGA